MSWTRFRLSRRPPSTASVAAMFAGAALVGAIVGLTLVNRRRAQRAERDNPPHGRFFEVDGVRLHYTDTGAGEPLVMLHGNGSLIQDWELSGLVAIAAKKHRVIAFDRPGSGWSERPRGRSWTPEAQADLIRLALERLGVRHPILLGHSWGATVAAQMALNHPEAVRALVLISGYYFPSFRRDVLALSIPAIPGLGLLLRHTILPLLSRRMWPGLVRTIFKPATVPETFAGFPFEMIFRPSQIAASAEDSAFMIPGLAKLRTDYASLRLPVVIVAGDEDQAIDTDQQSARLHRQIGQSRFHRIAGAGHMIHHTATDRVVSAIEEAAALSR